MEELDYEAELREALALWQWELDRSVAEIEKLKMALNDDCSTLEAVSLNCVGVVT